jgi:hypothetical protein
MKTSRTRRCCTSLSVLMLAAGITANAQFKAVGPAPYTPTVARTKIKALMLKMDPANRKQSMDTLSGLLSWYRDIADDELIAAWKKDDGRANFPDVIKTLADARVAAGVIEFSWHQQRAATFNLAYEPMLENLMLRFPDSAKPFLDDLLASIDPAIGPPLDLSEQEQYAVCRILLDMPDIRTWKKNALQILPHYRDVAENLLAADVNEGDPDRHRRAAYWLSDLRSQDAAASQPGPRKSMSPTPSAAAASADAAKSGTLECSGAPVPPDGEVVFPNVATVRRRFEYDRKIWDVRLVPGDGDTQNLILKNKTSSAQKHCVVRWSAIP